MGSAEFFMSQVGLTLLWLAVWLGAGRPDALQIAFINVLTVTTWLLLILAHNAQARDTQALQLKMDGVIAALDKADNRLIGIETVEEDVDA
jgi:low affinity Fe/Cu permease